MKRRILSLVIAIALVLAMLPAATPVVQAVTTSSYAPYAKIQYEYSADVECGTIRYISQLESSQYFNWNYWPRDSFGSYSAPISECGTSCLSMALSYVGVNKTPYDILNANNGQTVWNCWPAEYYGYGSNIAANIQTTFSNYLNGNGKYSPPVIHLTIGSSYSGAKDPGHFVLIIGQTSSNTWQILDPANNRIDYLTIDGVSLTYNGVNQKVNQIHQWYNPKANVCDHPSYDSLGICTSCGAEFDWASTFSGDGIGTYKVTNAFTPRTDKPYDAANKADISIAAGKKVEVLGMYENAFGNKWYYFSYNGEKYYVFESYLEYEGISSLKVTCTDFSPADQAVLEKKAQPVIGTVSSNYPLAAIYAYLDGNHYATWQAGNNSTTQVSLRETDINYALPFGSLSDGKHTIELIAHSFAHDTGVKCHSSVFYMTAKTEEDTRPGKPMLNVAVDDDFVTFTWGATNNTTHYNLWLAKKNTSNAWEEVEQIFYAQNGLSRTLEAGEYRAQLLSYNSNAWESDGSDWQHTWADDVFFTIDAGSYTVTFDANGGTDAPISQEVQAGASMFIPQSIPRYFGWNFKGWALTESASIPDYQPDEIITPTSDMVLYAVWEAPFQYYGADGYMCSVQVDYHGQGIYIQFWNPYPDTHYVLYGVGDEDNRVYLYDYDGNLLAFNDDGENGRNFELEYCFSSDEWYYIYVNFYSLPSTGELCFNIGRRYTITYDANGGAGAPKETYRYYGSGALLSATVPTREGYTFLGWATSANATSATYQPGDGFTPNLDTTLYAVWQRDVEEPDAKIFVSSTEAQPGETVAVTIAVKNNPGVASLKLKVSYDDMLTLTNISYNTAIGGQFQQPQALTCPVTLNWFNGAANADGDWVFATLTFAVSEKAQPQDIAVISVSYDPEDVYDITETNITFGIVEGEVEIADYIPGDINGDGVVNNKDLTRLFQYLSNWDVIVNEAALDVNGDGNVNNKDLTRLFQYLSNWNVEIH